MLLDAAISHPEVEWLATATDKAQFFKVASSCEPSRWPRQTAGGTERYFPYHLPIGVSATGRLVFVFLATNPVATDLQAFLRRHAELLQAMPAWTVRLVLPARYLAIAK